MVYLAFYNEEKDYIYPNMTRATADHIKANYGAVNVTKCVIETDLYEEMFFGVHTFNSLKTRYLSGVDLTDKTDDEILALIEEHMNTPEATTTEAPITSEERIASQLELQNLLAMPDEVQ